MSDNALFESNFIERTYPTIVSDYSTAFAEIVANSWDAGATRVDISIPCKSGEPIVIEDNGSGMTDEEFRSRWMVIAYNRVEHQGEYITFTLEDGNKARRLAYGRNGVGRHALICFDDHYTIETWKDGVLNTYELLASGGEAAFSITRHSQTEKTGNGTRITVCATKKLPDPASVVNTLGYKFIFDPQFNVFVNGIQVAYHNTLQADRKDTIDTQYGTIDIEIYKIPDGEKSNAHNGIAFWVNGRLVGKPNWSVGDVRVEDARRKFAIKHIIIVKADYLIDDVIYDWSGFRSSDKVNKTYEVLVRYIRKYRVEYYRGKTTEVRAEAVRINKEAIRNLSIPAVYDLKRFFDTYLEQKPDIEADDLNIIVSSLVNVLSNENGLSFLAKLSVMSNDSITNLDRILDEWSVADIKSVLDEINCRIKVIDAIQKLCSDPNTDELHVLHPLVSQAKWLFGIEYDNLNYTYNRRLSTVMKDLLESMRKEDTSINWDKRPDLVLTSDSSVSATCSEQFDENDIAYIDRILIIELKKGGFKIGRKEMNQAEEYVDSIFKGNKLNSTPKIKAFVIGDAIDATVSKRKTQEDYGEVYAYTYSQLVRTAEKRLFSLKEKLEEHYNRYNSEDYVKEILNEPEQLKIQEQ